MSVTVRCKYLSASKPTPIDITISQSMAIRDIIIELVRAYSMKPYDIDNGLCDYFASDLVAALEAIGKVADMDWTPDDDELPGHMWVECEDRFYDAETPMGVADWRELLIFKNSISR